MAYRGRPHWRLEQSLDALAKAGVNIESIDAICVGGAYSSFIWIDPAKIDKAAGVLNARQSWSASALYRCRFFQSLLSRASMFFSSPMSVGR